MDLVSNVIYKLVCWSLTRCCPRSHSDVGPQAGTGSWAPFLPVLALASNCGTPEGITNIYADDEPNESRINASHDSDESLLRKPPSPGIWVSLDGQMFTTSSPFAAQGIAAFVPFEFAIRRTLKRLVIPVLVAPGGVVIPIHICFCFWLAVMRWVRGLIGDVLMRIPRSRIQRASTMSHRTFRWR